MVWLLAAGVLWQTEVPDGLRLPALEPEDEFAPSELRAAEEYSALFRWLWAGSASAQVGVLGALAVVGPRLAERLRGGRIVRGLVLLLLALGLLWLVRLPFGLTAQWWRRRHEISRQGYVDWLVSPWLERAGVVLAAAFGLAVAMLLAKRLGRRWWLAGWPLLALIGAATVLAGPLLMTPRLDPLEDRVLAAEIQRLARESGAGEVEVEVKEAHRLTTSANAEVAGIGPTRKVILWDTLLDGRFPDDEVRFVAAHEVAHLARSHLWKGLGWFALLSLPIALALAEATRVQGGLGEPGAVPLAVLVAVALELALLPPVNAISRRYEAEADWVALEATRDPVAARGFLHRLSVTNLADPEPPGWSYVWRSTHPSLLERIAMARAWITVRRGEEPRAGS